MSEMIEAWQLKQRQSLPLNAKVTLSQKRIRQWYDHWRGQVYVSFSGGKDSTVLLDLVRSIFPHVPAVFVDTGLEFPEIREFVKTVDNVIWLKPAMGFRHVIAKYGYPVVSKEQAGYIREVQNGTTEYLELKRRGHQTGRNGKPVGAVSKKWQWLMDQQEIKVSEKCCDVMKKRPIHKYEKETERKPFIGTMAGESRLRNQAYLKNGCNAFDKGKPSSAPLSVWLEDDIWEYIKVNKIPYSKIYDMGYHRTGCMFCAFGAHLEDYPNRFQLMEQTHPPQWRYCMNKLGMQKVLDAIGVASSCDYECTKQGKQGLFKRELQ